MNRPGIRPTVLGLRTNCWVISRKSLKEASKLPSRTVKSGLGKGGLPKMLPLEGEQWQGAGEEVGAEVRGLT